MSDQGLHFLPTEIGMRNAHLNDKIHEKPLKLEMGSLKRLGWAKPQVEKESSNMPKKNQSIIYPIR